MDITGLQQKMGAEQQAQIQRILDQQYADFREQRDYPYQQLGYLSDVLRGAGGSTRSVYSSPQASPLQTLVGMGTAAYGASRMAEGGEVRGYADGGITSVLGDQQLQKEAQQPRSPMMGMAAQQEMAERAQLRAAAPDGLQDASEVSDEQLVEILRQALQTGDEETAAVAAAMLEERKAVNDSGIAAVAPDSVGEVPEGGIVQMAGGGKVGYVGGGDTTWWERELLRLQDPNMMPPESDEPNFWTYSSDVEAQRKRREAAQAQPTSAGPDTGDDRQRLLARYPKPEQPAPQAGIDKVAPTDRNVPPGAAGGAPATGLTSIAGVRKLMGQAGMDLSPLQGRLEERSGKITEAEVAGIDEQEALMAELYNKVGPYGENVMQRAEADLSKLEGKEDKIKAMSFLEAGLAILSADPARGGWAAIGSGAIQGLKSYKGDVEKLDEKRSKLLDKIDEVNDLRRQEQLAQGKEKIEFRKQRRAAQTEGERRLYDITKEFGLKEFDLAKTVFQTVAEAREAQADRQSRSSSGAALPADIRIAEWLAAQRGTKPADELERLYGARRQPASLERARSDWARLQQDPVARMEQKRRGITTFEQYWQSVQSEGADSGAVGSRRGQFEIVR